MGSQIRSVRIPGTHNQHVQVIGHQKKYFKTPPPQHMIASSRFKQSARGSVQTKLIYTATLAANCYEIGRAESTVKMSRMVQLFSHPDASRRGGSRDAGD